MIIVSSCQNDDDNYVSISTLDMALNTAINNASGNVGKIHYLLPASTNFSGIPQDPNNPINTQKVELGKLLFHETEIAKAAELEEGMGTYSCASCHHAAAGFQAGKRQGLGDGGIGFGIAGEMRHMNTNYDESNIDKQPIKTPPALNTAYQKLMLWNGQFGATDQNIGTEAQWTVGTPKETNNLGFEGVETQAIAGLTVHRLEINETLMDELGYKAMFDSAFPGVSESERYTSTTAGLAIAAYERTLLANQAPFQKWLQGDQNAMSDNAKHGAVLFFGKAQCYQCHDGPSLGAMDFAAIGMRDLTGPDIIGDVDEGTKKGRGGFTQNPADNYKFKIPQLYNLKDNGSFGHGASFTNLKDVIVYKNNAVKENTEVPDTNLDPLFRPLGLSEIEINYLTIFLEEGLTDINLQRYTPEDVMSGNCLPNNDSQSQTDLGCN